MKRYILVTACLLLALIMGCAGGDSPASPDPLSDYKLNTDNSISENPTVLWGYYTIELDLENREVNVIAERSGMFTANVVGFVNGNPANLGFNINNVIYETDYIDVDIDVKINHPFPGFPRYNGYDVRGVFMGDGSQALGYNTDLLYADYEIDQCMLADPLDGYGGADGYTRWFNLAEFSEGGMPLFQYTQGILATPGFSGTATLNPYKYFADGLDEIEDIFGWLDANPDRYGMFASGAQNTRNYYIRFPFDMGATFGYAITANWEGNEPEYHPANMYEAAACEAVYSGSLYYIDPAQNGGDIVLDISIFDWHSAVTSSGMEDYRIILESSVLQNPYEFSSADMIPVGGNENYSTYHVEIPADNVSTPDGNEYWIIVEYPDHGYTNDFGTENLAGDAPLAAFFRYDLPVTGDPDNLPPDCDIVVVSEIQVGCGIEVTFDATGSSDPDGDPITFEWDFDGDDVFGDAYEGDPDYPTYTYFVDFTGDACVKVSDDNGAESTCCAAVNAPVDSLTKNIDVTNPSGEAKDMCIDHLTGDVLVVYDNRIVRNYHADDCYTTYNTYNIPNNCKWIDMGTDGKWLTGFSDPWDGVEWGGHFYYYHYNHDGTLIWANGNGWHQGTYDIRDLVTMGPNGTRANDHAFLFYLTTGDGTWATHLWANRDEYDFTGANYWRILFYHGPATVPGIDKIYGPWIMGVEADREDDCLWVVEDTEFVAARFDVSGYSYDYQGQYFGEQNVAGDDDDHINDPIDITRNNNNNSYLLDLLSTGDYVIKVWSYDTSGTESMGSFGDASDFDLTPIAVDGGDYDGRIAVLHTDGSNANISVFLENETPG